MVEGGAGQEFPVVFYDGEREINIGNIKIYPLQEFKAFQSMLSQRIGISPNQISIYLCDKKREDRRKTPVTSKTNFSFIALEKDCFFLVVLKRSRKSRNRKAKDNFSSFITANKFPLADDLILLRRNRQEFDLGFESPYYDQVLQMELDHLMYTNNSNPNLNPNLFPRVQDSYQTMMTKNLAVCEECRGKNGNSKSSSFHHCVNDPVVFVGGYPNRYGPVGQPVNFY